MGKLLKKVNFLVLTVIATFVFVVGINGADAAAAPSSITVKRTQTLEDLVNNYKYGFVVEVALMEKHFIVRIQIKKS